MPDSSDEPLADDGRIWVLLDRYVAGEPLAADDAIVQEWLAADASRAEIVEDLRRIRGVVLASRRHRPASVAWERFLQRMRVASVEATPHDTARVRMLRPHQSRLRVSGLESESSGRARMLRAVAATIVVAAGALTVFMHHASSQASAISQRPPSGSSRTFATPRGRRADVHLPDGTLVSLAPESRVTWQVSADTLVRDVLLEGEAYFDVVHDAARPFGVHVRNAVIRDIGTRFAVRAYATDRSVRVVVTHGSVRVDAATAPPGSGSIVASGMLGLVDADGATSLRRHADTALYNAFVRGQMRFVRTPLRIVIGELARWYDVDIRLADSTLGDRLISATMDNQTLPDLLMQFGVALNLHARRTGRTVVLRGD